MFANVNPASGDNSYMVGAFAIFAIGCVGLWRFQQWFFSGPLRPDPWDAQVAAEIEEETATPVCHRCLEPHSTSVDFCPHCAAPVGTYTNLLPYPYLFSVGHMLRIGTGGDFKRTPLNVIGFVLLSLAEYAVFAPVYWFVMARRLQHPPPPVSDPPPEGG